MFQQGRAGYVGRSSQTPAAETLAGQVWEAGRPVRGAYRAYAYVGSLFGCDSLYSLAGRCHRVSSEASTRQGPARRARAAGTELSRKHVGIPVAATCCCSGRDLQVIDTFNMAVASIEKEKAKLESDLKNADMKLLVLYEEMPMS